MILSDQDIRFFMRVGKIAVDPAPHDVDIQPASLEVHLEHDYSLKPGEFRLANTIQTITVHRDLAAQLTGKSSLGRLGLQVHATAGFIDPGFSGQIVLELANLSDQVIELRHQQAIGQLIFHELRTPSIRSYGHPALESHYQGQKGITPSYLA